MVDLIVNELSFRLAAMSDPQPCAATPHEARTWMSLFVNTIRTAPISGAKRTIRMDNSLQLVTLSAGYTLADWRSDILVNRDERLYFASLAAKYPALDGTNEMIQERSGRMEVHFNGQTGLGLLAAVLMDGITLSLSSDPVWRTTRIPVIVTEITVGDQLEVAGRGVPNSSDALHWIEHTIWIENRQRADLTIGLELWSGRAALFPNLEFCGDTRRQIEALSGHERHFRWVIEALCKANVERGRWTSGEFPHHLLPGPASGESGPTLKNKEMLKQRMFSTPTGEPELFQFHMKNNSENQRIHYLFNSARQKLLIGYVGDHLPTATSKT